MKSCCVEITHNGCKGEKPRTHFCNNPASEYRYTEISQSYGKTQCVELRFCQACAKRYDQGRIQVKYPTPPDPVSQSSREVFQYVQYVQYGGE